MKDHPHDYCNNKNTVDVRIDYICRGEPIISHKEASGFVHQFRTVHRIEDRYYQYILNKCNECKTSLHNEQSTMEAKALVADDLPNATFVNQPDENQPTLKTVKPKKIKKEETLDEFAKDWIEHGNCWYEKDFEGFSLTFEDFRGVMHNVFHGKHVSDVELQQAWDKAVYAIQKDPTNTNTQEIPLAGEKPKTTATKPLKPDFKTKVISAAPKSGTDSHENKVSYQQKRGVGFTDHVDMIFRLFLSSAVWYLKRLKQISMLIDKAKRNLDREVNNESLIGLSRLQDSLTYFNTSIRGNEVLLSKLKFKLQIDELDADLIEDVNIEMTQARETTSIYSNILESTMDTYQSIINNNMNTIMRTLTSVTIILMLPTLVASFFGMNLINGMENSPIGFIIAILISILISVASWFLFRRKRLI